MLRALRVVSAALTLCACESPPKPDAAPKTEAPAATTDPAKKPEALADEAAKPTTVAPTEKRALPAPVTLAFHPAQWAELHLASMPLLTKLPGEFEPVRKAASAEALLSMLATRIFGIAPPKVQGWDTSRPILIALAETDTSGVAGATVGQLPLDEGWVAGLRHQALVPASDPQALMKSLSSMLASGEKQLPDLAKDHPGAVAMGFDDWSVVLLPADKAVRVVVFETYFGLPEDKAQAHMRTRLDDPIHTTASVAAAVLADDGAVFAAWIRPDRLRSAAVTSSAGQMLAAVATVAPDTKPRIMAAGLDVLLSSDAAMVDEGAEIDELAIALRVDGDVLRLSQLSLLSEEGEKAFAAATKDVSPTFATAPGPAWADLVVRADLRALLDAIEPPSFAHPSEGAGPVYEVIRQGGPFAVLHLGTRHGLGLARFAELVVGTPPFPTDTAPTAAHVVWTGMAKGELPKVAIALHWPKGHDIGELTRLFESLAKDQDLASLEVHTTDYEGAPTHVLGLGGLSEKAFAMDKPSPAKPVIELRADVPALVAAASEGDAEVKGWFKETSPALFTVRHHPHALVGALAWSPSGATVEAKPGPEPKIVGTPAPVGDPANTAASRCVGQAAFAYSETLAGLVRAAPETIEVVVSEGLTHADEAIACAETEPAAKAAAHGLRRIVVASILDALADETVRASIQKQQCALDKSAPYCEAPAP